MWNMHFNDLFCVHVTIPTYLQSMQTMPDGTPPFVNPSLEKQDLPQTKRDIPKYDLAGVLPSEASNRFNQLLEVFETKYGSCRTFLF